jgi:hypothetical protein
MKYGRSLVFAVAAAGLFFGGLLWGQGMQKKMDMNDIPYAKVKAILSNPQEAAKAKKMARKNHVMLMGGHPINGKPVTLKGELTGADCYLSAGFHGHHHALCSKACVAHGGPIVFLAQNGTVYLALPHADGTSFTNAELNALGVPGVTVMGNAGESHDIRYLSIHSVRR